MRCGKAGVLVCEGFDTDAAFGTKTVRNGKVYYTRLGPNGDGVYEGSIDHTIYASGGGSLHFHIPSNTPANNSGGIKFDMGRHFGENTTFYVQYRQRFSDTMLTNKWLFSSSGWKQSIFYQNGASCASIELTTVNLNYWGVPIMYTECGARGFASYPSWNTLGDGLVEQGPSEFVGYNCHYWIVKGTFPQSRWPSNSCAYYKPNQWMTFYFRVHVGTWGQPNSSVEAWMGYEGGPLKMFQYAPKYVLNDNTSASDYFNSVTLTTYMTGKKRSQVHPPADTWYDELIISSQPIDAP